jgi:hypothetical protein
MNQNQTGIAEISVLVEKLTLKPGDILALCSKKDVPHEVLVRYGEMLKDIVPEGVKALILAPGITFQVIEPPQQP